MKQFFLAVVLCICASPLFSQAKQFSFNNEKRRYIIYLPKSYSQATEKSFPVVFNFHGGGMTMAEQMFYSRMNVAAEKHQFIVVYPQGIKQDWNVGFETSYQNGTDDVGFINALLEKLVKEHRINTARVYATGLSRGGFFCQRLAAELPEKFAAIASVGGPLPDSVAFFHTKKLPVGVMIVHGTGDEIVKYDGKKDAYQSAADTYNYWKKHNGLEYIKEVSSNIDRIKKDSTSVTSLEISSGHVAVALITIKGGGHTLPGTDPFNIGFPLGHTTQEIDNNELIWRFFSHHKR
jgi:polyhydroxybutyrate depolymerase